MSGTVLVTGAGGFVGSAVFRHLARETPDGGVTFSGGVSADRIVGVLRPGGSRERLAELEAHEAWTLVEADVTDPESIRGLVLRTRPRAVLHLALEGAVHEPMPDERRRELAIVPLETLVEALAEAGGERFIHTGSAWVLRAGTDLDEATPVEPANPYAETKAWEDRRLAELGQETGVAWINLRLFNIFGKYEPKTRLLPHLVSRLSQGLPAELSDPERVRDFNDVGDMARAYALALRSPGEACDRVYHVGSGRGTSVRAFADTVADVTGNRELIRFDERQTADGDMDRLVADPERARRDLGWSPPESTGDRVRGAARWWLTHLEGDG